MTSRNYIKDCAHLEADAAVALANLCTLTKARTNEKQKVQCSKSKQSIQHDQNQEDYDAKIFPQRLYEVLSDKRNEDAIRWLDHGLGFIINDRKKFASDVLPRCFKKTKYTSFTRKMNRWNFHRVSRGPELGAYYHKYFQRGKPHLCIQMYCKNDRAIFATTMKQANLPAEPSQHRDCENKQRLQQNPPSALNGTFPLTLLPSERIQMRINQLNDINLAAQWTLKRRDPVVFTMNTATAAVIDAAMRALQRSSTMETGHMKLVTQKPSTATLPLSRARAA
uniref:HSF-type DNA-binding domain-containing protein n=1 Tax=Ditylum brightwellii TaxID=49249 RepID=A0A7S2EVL2_9STRA|mmetsp:Transcript_7901/g.11771  ORF Transcript_7901/g.11771 Transcript_7901/m.11771 type:complete len:280 (+) Transcript_7901:35-874(+)